MNKYRRLRAGVAVIVGILSVSAFAGLFYPFRIFDLQLTALLQRILIDFSLQAAVLLALLLLASFVFGRVYCSALCPFGLLQELVTLVFRRKTAGGSGHPGKYFLAAAVFGALAGGTAVFVRLIDPYALFGSAAGGARPGMAAAVLLVLLAGFKGRLFCSRVCPVGTVLGIISKHAVNKIYIEEDKCVSCGLCADRCPTGSIDFKSKTVDNETCVKCFNCLGRCRKDGLRYGRRPAPEIPFSPGRRRLLVGGILAAVFVLALKNGAELGKNFVLKTKNAILPPGAGNAEEFAGRCLNCNLCVRNCPMHILRKADENYPAVHIDYTGGFCDHDCHKCSEVCPSGAIRRLTPAEKRRTQIGLAVLNADACIKCGLCIIKCPGEAINRKDDGFPQIDENKCVGCGLCQSACPAKALSVIPVERQKTL